MEVRGSAAHVLLQSHVLQWPRASASDEVPPPPFSLLPIDDNQARQRVTRSWPMRGWGPRGRASMLPAQGAVVSCTDGQRRCQQLQERGARAGSSCAGEGGVALAWSSRRRCSASDCSAFWASCRASCSCTTPRPPCRSPRSRLLWAAGAPATSPCRAWNAGSGCRTLHRYACDLALRAVIHVTRPGPQQGLRAAAGAGAEEASAELQAARKHALLMQRMTARQLCNGDAAAIAPSCRPARASTLLTVHRQE